jgi:pentatricopeptide repeat protein
MFSACARAGPKSTEILKKLRDEIERRNVHLEKISTNALMAALAACGFHDDTWDIYNGMIERAVNPDPQTFTSLLVATTHDKVGGFEAAQRAWSEMSIPPDLHCFNVLLQCIRDCGIDPSILERVDKEKRTIDLKLDLVNFEDGGSLICQDEAVSIRLHVSGVAGFALGDGSTLKVYVGQVLGRGVRGPTIRWLETEDIEKLLSFLKKLQLPPEVMTFNLLAQLTFDVSFLVREMAKLKRRKVRPDSQFVVTAIKKQALLGNLPGAKVHNNIIHLCQRNKNIEGMGGRYAEG